MGSSSLCANWLEQSPELVVCSYAGSYLFLFDDSDDAGKTQTYEDRQGFSTHSVCEYNIRMSFETSRQLQIDTDPVRIAQDR